MPDDSANRRLKIEAHDASRVEWSIYIPLPRGPSVSEAEVSLRLEFPENVYVPHDGWEQLQILELLTIAEETCGQMLAPAGLPGQVAEKLREAVAGLLAAELLERERRGEMLPDGDDLEALALFLDRAAQLKKHFQEVLFLEPETKMVDEALRNWVGLSGAATAFIVYFGLQALQTSAAAGLGLWTLMTVGAVAYALKDRAKELTRQWLAGKLSHLYANRVLVLREPAKFEHSRNVVLRARESLAQARVARPDPLNPGSGAVQRLVTLDYRQRARVTGLTG